MNIGLIDVDSHNFPNLALMKISAYHKAKGDTVEWCIPKDLYRVRKIAELGYYPDVRIYRKSTAPRVLRDLQRWCNNRFLYRSCDFEDYVPRKDGRTIKEIYPEIFIS